MSASVEPYRESFQIRSYESSPDARVSVQSLCNYLQEVAGNHARELGLSIEQLVDDNLTWVLGKLRLEVDELPQWRESVEIETWPSGENGVVATRDFLLRTQGREFGRATSAWFMLDVERRRPVRLPSSMRELVLPDRPAVLAHEFPAIDTADRFDHEVDFRVRRSDLDMNRHVNNVRYIEWALESLPLEQINDRHLRELHVHFKAETLAGQTVRVRTAALGDGRGFIHRVMTVEPERDVALLTTSWASR